VSHCVPLCGLGAPRWRINLSAEPEKAAVNDEIEARSEETQQILLSADTPAPEPELVAESDTDGTYITTEEKTEQAPPAEPTPRAVSKPVPVSSEPKPGTIAIIDGVKSLRATSTSRSALWATALWSEIPATSSQETR